MRTFEDGLTPVQAAGLDSLLTSIENDPYLTRIEWAAYMLVTVKHETAHTYQPIHEYGGKAYFIRRYGSQTKVGKRLGNDTPEEGADYAGRGDVQITGETNYEKAEAALREFYPEIVAEFERRTGKRFDLTVGDQPNDKHDPDNAMDPAIAYAIMSFGMRTGMFTTKSLADFTTAKGFNALKGRTIINGTDKAAVIAGYYKQVLPILQAALVPDSPSVEAETAETTSPDKKPHSDPAPNQPTDSTIAGDQNSGQGSAGVSAEKPAEDGSTGPSFVDKFDETTATVSKYQDRMDAVTGFFSRLPGVSVLKAIWARIYQIILLGAATVAGVPLRYWVAIAVLALLLSVAYKFRKPLIKWFRDLF